MRILQVHNHYREAGGEDAVVASEAKLLRRAGHEVLTLTSENPKQLLPAAAKFARAPWNPRAAREMMERASGFDPDVAHVHNTWFALSPAIISALQDQGIPVVMTLHNYRLICANSYLYRDGGPCEKCVGTHPWHAVRHSCYNSSAVLSVQAAATIASNRRRGTWQRDVDLYFALTRFARDRFLAGGLPAERIRIKPHFVEDPGPRTRPPSASNDVLYVGRLAPEKGTHVLIDAINQQDTYNLVVIGHGEQREELQGRAGPRVRFLGELAPQDVAREMLGARALAFPSLTYETFGLVLVEAMAAGLPILASNLGGTPDLLGPECGHLVAPGKIEEWVVALRHLERDAIDAMGVAGRDRWDSRFSVEAALPMLEGGYRRALAAHRPRGDEA